MEQLLELHEDFTGQVTLIRPSSIIMVIPQRSGGSWVVAEQSASGGHRCGPLVTESSEEIKNLLEGCAMSERTSILGAAMA